METRIVPTGNVTAALVNGNLVITGDEAGNLVHVSPGIGDSIIVRPAFESATTINGGSEAVLPGSITGNIKANMQGGDDVLVVEETSVGKSVVVKMGTGQDDFRLVGGVTTKNVKVHMGGTESAGPESTVFAFPDIRGSLKYTGGNGPQSVLFLGGEIGRNTSMNMGAGNDSILIDSTDFRGNFKANGGKGTDVFGGPRDFNTRNFESSS